MKLILCISLFISLISLAEAKSCQFETSKSYFQDLEGEVQLLPQTKSYKMVYSKMNKFIPDYPIEAALRIPYSGDCSDAIVFKVEVFRAFGPNKMAGGEDDHASHVADTSKFTWEKRPYFSGKKTLSIKDGMITLEKFEINKMIEEAPKTKHFWRFKFIISYQANPGTTETYEKIVESPLIH